MYQNGYLKVAAASVEVKLGNPDFNVTKILNALKVAEENKVGIIGFPELAITGYSMGDLFFQKYLYDEANQAIERLLKENPFSGFVILGSYIIINDTLYNSILVIQKDKILGIVPKTFLPHTNEFYEDRWFINSKNIVNDLKEVEYLNQRVPFGKLLFEDEAKEIVFGAEVCADVWAPNSPNELLYSNGAIIVFNASASPSHVGKKEKRRTLTKSSSMKFNSAYIYVSNNASESTSEVVFSGHNIITENGKIIEECGKMTFEEKIIYADIDIQKLHFLRRNNSYFKVVQDNNRDLKVEKIKVEFKEIKDYKFEKEFDKLPFVPKNDEEFMDVINIQAHSVLKRLNYINIKTSVLGLSGGLDSSLALLSLVHAYDLSKIDRKNIHVLIMPTKQTSKTSLSNARKLAKAFGVSVKEINIDKDVSRQLSLIEHSEEEKDTTFENVQARYRTYTLMNYANKHKGIVIGTSDMSEIALGWSTFNGDQMAMYGINAGLTKTAVITVMKYYKSIHKDVASIIDSIVDAPISPELLSESQDTEAVLGKYEINDFILYHFLVNGADQAKLVFLIKLVFKLTDEKAKWYVNNFNKRFYANQYKRLTSPEAAKILDISLSPRTSFKIAGDTYRTKK